MAIDQQQAALDLNAKLRLEAQLRPEVTREQSALARDVTRALAASGTLPDVAALETEAMGPILRRHYDRVEGVFGHRVSDQLPADVAASPEERIATAIALALLWDTRAPAQAAVIGGNSQTDAERAVADANAESARLRADGEEVTLRDEAVIAGVIFSRRLWARTTGIVALETQVPAEASKLQETMILTGTPGRADEPLPQPPPAQHMWITVGDDLVRTSPGRGHLGADTQVVLIGSPFVVGGQRLMYPGDSSLGATIDNTINCRCSAVADVAAVATLRRAA